MGNGFNVSIGGAYRTSGNDVVLLVESQQKARRWEYKARHHFGAIMMIDRSLYNDDGEYLPRIPGSMWNLTSRMDDDPSTAYDGDGVVMAKDYDPTTAPVIPRGSLGIMVGLSAKVSVMDHTSSTPDLVLMFPTIGGSADVFDFPTDIEEWTKATLDEELGQATSPGEFRKHCFFVPPDHVDFSARLGGCAGGAECPTSPSGSHEHVNVGFTSVFMACKHCGKSRD